MDEVTVWAGWVGGLGIGLYLLVQWWMSGQALGASTGYGNVCALGSSAPFFRTGSYADPRNWRLWFTLGIPIGGVVAVLTSPEASLGLTTSMGAMYEQVMPSSLWLRAPVLVGGGIAIGYGSRMAGGCTSGHSISGLAMLNPPSLLASVGFFLGGIVSVQILFRMVA